MDFTKDGNGISTTVTVTRRYDYAELLKVKENLEYKLAENQKLIDECIKLKVELPKEEVK